MFTLMKKVNSNLIYRVISKNLALNKLIESVMALSRSQTSTSTYLSSWQRRILLLLINLPSSLGTMTDWKLTVEMPV
jgi:hypothetical protein